MNNLVKGQNLKAATKYMVPFHMEEKVGWSRDFGLISSFLPEKNLTALSRWASSKPGDAHRSLWDYLYE